VLEGTWSGYTSSQSRVVHRTVERRSTGFPNCIVYSDGTRLFLSVRPAKPRERVQEIHGYDELIRKCVRYDVAVVDLLGHVECGHYLDVGRALAAKPITTGRDDLPF